MEVEVETAGRRLLTRLRPAILCRCVSPSLSLSLGCLSLPPVAWTAAVRTRTRARELDYYQYTKMLCGTLCARLLYAHVVTGVAIAASPSTLTTSVRK